MAPALGVTEPGAIAFAAAKARTLIAGKLRHLTVSMNSGLYKNAYSCGIPGAEEVGAVFAAALGYAAGDPDKELESLSGITQADLVTARQYVESGKVTAELSESAAGLRFWPGWKRTWEPQRWKSVTNIPTLCA